MSSGPRPRLRLEDVDGVTVVSFTDSKIVTEDQIQEVGDQLNALTEDGAKQKILLNFGNVQYCSSTVLGKLVGFKRRIDKNKGKLKFCCIHPDLMIPFKLTGLDKVFEMYAEEQAALDKF
ncbi:Anti-sigma-B factor antagonist [Aquisphaera giovannonii]|uniref:Anti-sigma-B factor antagonist n=1 Tax=Aquisphaera giovannonii TaxID=406548 RepID=A0A5B9WCJ8_9BACT|nr:STAS domain-containing protein [Aquisphaera giovannonii]QEH38247.1 Anti-sigma-B factor antagonist [Aquisphaera giovannonii]